LKLLKNNNIQKKHNKTNRDSLVRLIAVVQIVWTATQIIVRAVRHLAISQLEIAVVAFAVCAIITYALNWSKPKGVQVPCTLLQFRNGLPERICRVLDKQEKIDESLIDFLAHFFTRDKQGLGGPLSNHSNVQNTGLANLGFLVTCIVFGSLHLTVWNFIFPTMVEKILRRAASLFCTSPPFWFLIIGIMESVVKLRKHPPWRLWMTSYQTFFLVLTTLYIFARLFLLVEIFRTLCFLPPDAYTSTWATNIPHIA
jgi:hypothetical protein